MRDKSTGPLSTKMKEALIAISEREAQYGRGSSTAIRSNLETWWDPVTVWCNYQTARALELRGLVELHDWVADEGWLISMTEAGKAWVTAQELNTVLP